MKANVAASMKAIGQAGNVFNISLGKIARMFTGDKKKASGANGASGGGPDVPPEYEQALRHHLDKLIKNNEVVVFASTTCKYCNITEDVLSQHKVSYKKINLNNYMEMEGEFVMLGPLLFKYVKELTGRRTVPNIIVKE